MNSKYTGSKVRNQFTAYLVSQIRGRRRIYLERKIRISSVEDLKADFPTTKEIHTLDEYLEMVARERTLLNEAQGNFPAWDEMTDLKLVQAIMSLREIERKLVYQRIFEEMTYKEIGRKNGMSATKAKGLCSYAIRKMRKKLKGED